MVHHVHCARNLVIRSFLRAFQIEIAFQIGSKYNENGAELFSMIVKIESQLRLDPNRNFLWVHRRFLFV